MLACQTMEPLTALPSLPGPQYSQSTVSLGLGCHSPSLLCSPGADQLASRLWDVKAAAQRRFLWELLLRMEWATMFADVWCDVTRRQNVDGHFTFVRRRGDVAPPDAHICLPTRLCHGLGKRAVGGRGEGRGSGAGLEHQLMALLVHTALK
ncbi:unnamed protein product [Pleuronectes platessa]|uniref:Uncharacterized protein n=1 Tax=Pleuronectes platessa TaxID=8262 RepID=A0A9N7UGX3_PLEPL|nr:unnamed protein product [Pleuronectes platessa]